VSFGGGLRCDFCWLNDNSYGPEWVLVEMENPKLKIFNSKNEPAAELNHAIEQVRSWVATSSRIQPKRDEYSVPYQNFVMYWSLVQKRIGKREMLHCGGPILMMKEKIEIRSSSVFYESLRHYIDHEGDFWSFKEHPVSLMSKDLKRYCDEYGYLQKWRTILN
jgi:hypothetical protein